jgi:hypothetical protein
MTISRKTVLNTLNCDQSEYPEMLAAKFPHVLKKILELWNSPGCGAYFTELLRTDGGGGGRMNRNGFPKQAWNEIFRLNALYRKPRPVPKK